MPPDATITEALPEDAPAIAAIHLAARQLAMPYLRLAHTDDETRDYFAGAVCDRPRAWWVMRHQGQVAAYMLIDGEDLDHLYVAPAYQGRRFGSALLARAKDLSPHRIELWTFQRNARARAFYEAHGFHAGRSEIIESAGRRIGPSVSWCAKAHHPRLAVSALAQSWMAGLRPP